MTQLIESVLGGGGEMGARMRAFDWSATPLGPVEQWPQSLRVCVRIALDSAHPMSIVWGPDLILLYNDENRAMFGAKGATALGHRIRDVFPEMWEYTGPIYEKAMRQRQATVLADQELWLTRDFFEEGFYTVSFSPIPDDSGHVGGVFVTGIETTGRVIGERRLQVIHDLASRTAEARYQDEVWRASAAALGEHRHTIPFSFLYACRPGEGNASRIGPGVEPHTLDPPVIDCTRQNLWGFDIALAKEGLVIDLGERASLMQPPMSRCLSVPLAAGDHLVGVLTLYAAEHAPLDAQHGRLLQIVTPHVAQALAAASDAPSRPAPKSSGRDLRLVAS